MLDLAAAAADNLQPCMCQWRPEMYHRIRRAHMTSCHASGSGFHRSPFGANVHKIFLHMSFPCLPILCTSQKSHIIFSAHLYLCRPWRTTPYAFHLSFYRQNGIFHNTIIDRWGYTTLLRVIYSVDTFRHLPVECLYPPLLSSIYTPPWVRI